MTELLLDKDGKPIKGQVLPDRGSIKMSLNMMDGDALRSIGANLMTDGQRITFADAVNAGQSAEDAFMAALTGRSSSDSQAQPAVFHKPSQSVLSESGRAAKEKVLDARDARAREAWRDPPAADPAQNPKPAPTMPANDADSRYAQRLHKLTSAWKGA